MTAKPRLLVTRRLPERAEAQFREHFEATLNASDVPLDREALTQAMTRYDALCTTLTERIDAQLLATPGRTVWIIGNFGAGTEHIDLAAARAQGVVVTNTPDAVTEATADLALLLILMASRRAGEGERELRAQRWSGWHPTHLMGQSLSGKVLGLVGFGRIAQATAARARAFGLRIRYHSRSRASAETETAFAAEYVPSLEALAEQADVLSIHVPGGAATRHLVDAGLLARMKPTAILVNTARGTSVDEAALAEALAERRIAAAGLDVYEREPVVDPALLALENVVLLPHLGSATLEARTAMGLQAALNLDAWFAGREPPNRVA
jgi:lactate dehydrogenase-like 2-hydroxyacid dehydrogenase